MEMQLTDKTVSDYLYKTIEDARLILSSYPDAIYAWLPTNDTDNRSIRISYNAALEWCEGVHRDGDRIPLSLSNEEVFIGCLKRLIL